jgi:hypothetical protein
MRIVAPVLAGRCAKKNSRAPRGGQELSALSGGSGELHRLLVFAVIVHSSAGHGNEIAAQFARKRTALDNLSASNENSEINAQVFADGHDFILCKCRCV